MSEGPSIIERAFQIAKSGKVSTVDQVREQLAQEGYSNADSVRGRSLLQQISRMIVEAKPVST